LESLDDWGWDPSFQTEWDQRIDAERGALWMPGRVIRHQHHIYDLVVPRGGDGVAVVRAGVSGRFDHEAESPEDYPTVGDWVAVEVPSASDGAAAEGPVRIVGLLKRRSAIRRLAAGGGATTAQVIASNIDTLFLVFGLDGGRNFLISLLERALTVAWESGAQPVVLLNKADLADPDERESAREEAEAISIGAPVHLISARSGEGIETLAPYLASGATIALLGKSGVGKSALVNALGEGATAAGAGGAIAREGGLRGDLQGRHTTTHKELYRLPGGALIADVPGLRELALWSEDGDLDQTFADIAELAETCRFRDCRHESEPGCAVRAAVEEGRLDPERLERYHALQREIAYLESRRDTQGRQDSKARWKTISKAIKTYYKERDR